MKDMNEFYQVHKGKTNLKIAQMEAIESYGKTHTKVDFEKMTTLLKHLKFITIDEYIDLDSINF